ncbi:hypothetical protein IT570_12145 [Candidatus Sumerlaeota bacterium]|nr:hypothetical protein [Candidatus Sumerlaeota bacterium]
MTHDASQRLLFVGRDFSSIPSLEGMRCESRLWFEFRHGLAGAWTALKAGEEIVTFGHPAASPNRWFRVLTPPQDRHNAASLALERIIFARRITTLVICDCSIQAVALKGSAVHRSHLAVHSRNDGELMDLFFQRIFPL